MSLQPPHSSVSCPFIIVRNEKDLVISNAKSDCNSPSI
jgi:hypothetical protein